VDLLSSIDIFEGTLGEGRPRRDEQDGKETIEIPTWKMGETAIIEIVLKTASVPQRSISLTCLFAVVRRLNEALN
jgi:hypothetical protein